ncbi:MAG: putative sodium/hydrogen exchanger, partial [Monoraphidium minutum]
MDPHAQRALLADPKGGPDPSSSQESAHITSLSTGLLVLLVILWSLAGHRVARRSRYLTEGSAACLLGLATGLGLLAAHGSGGVGREVARRMLAFDAGGFFTYLLPPIIFYCGLSVEKHRFFINLPSILLLGVLGTLASFAITGVILYVFLGFTVRLQDALAMGAIFAATDSVATLQVLDATSMPGLFSLVFGEGVINDAVSVVLLGAIARSTKDGAWAGGFGFNFAFLLVTSTALGAAVGLAIAWVLKSTAFAGPHQELAVMTLLAYSSWLLADLAGLSAILALFVTGMMVSHYALGNISADGRDTAVNAFRTLAYVAEGMVFVYVGMDCLDPEKWKSAHLLEALWLVLVLSALLLLARAAIVVPFSWAHNLMPHADRLSARDVVIVWWSGLMRGAVSVALVYLHFDNGGRARATDRQQSTLIVSTLMVVMLSITVVGALTKPLMALLLRREEGQLAAQLSAVPLLGRMASPATDFSQPLPSHYGSGSGGGYEMPPVATPP